MKDILLLFKDLCRPQLLITAARIAASEFRRDRDLSRLLRTQRLPAPGAGLPQLIALEGELETIRKEGNSTYSISRHVEVLAALIAEARLLARPSTS